LTLNLLKFDVERIKQNVIKCCFQNTSKNKIGSLYLWNFTSASTGW